MHTNQGSANQKTDTKLAEKYHLSYSDDGVASASYTFTEYERTMYLQGGESADEICRHFVKITEQIADLLHEMGMPELSTAQKAQWWGEIMLHFYGDIAWDYSQNNIFGKLLIPESPYLERCKSVELAYANGSVDDFGHGELSDYINDFSKIYSIGYYVYKQVVISEKD